LQKKRALLELGVSSLRRGHANLLCIILILPDDPRREFNCSGPNFVAKLLWAYILAHAGQQQQHQHQHQHQHQQQHQHQPQQQEEQEQQQHEEQQQEEQQQKQAQEQQQQQQQQQHFEWQVARGLTD
jgi:septal ring factor EnvC (AmiA/AmiB activator)